MKHWINGDDYQQNGGGFMGKEWDSFVPNPKYWKECYRVMKPGAHILCFASTRTWDLMSIALRFAGFQNRDTIANFKSEDIPAVVWCYATGFPKSYNISKAVDRMAGAEREVTGIYQRPDGKLRNYDQWSYENNGATSFSTKYERLFRTAPSTDHAKQWEGWGTALKPAWEVILVFRKPISEKNIADNVLKWGTGGINIDASRIGLNNEKPFYKNGDIPSDSGMWSGKKRIDQSGNSQGRFPTNIMFTHHPDCICVCEQWQCHSDCPVAILNQQSGIRKSGAAAKTRSVRNRIFKKNPQADNPETCNGGDSGYASRFFFCAKASPSERNEGCENLPKKVKVMGNQAAAEMKRGNDPTETVKKSAGMSSTKQGNHHPTVKSIKIMEYLLKLVTPPDAVVLDPFMGSGTTGCACAKLNRRFIGIEKEPEYFEIAKARIEYELNKEKQIEMFEG
jgi:site-specific DNA-methyltransferase (adenine-specific)